MPWPNYEPGLRKDKNYDGDAIRPGAGNSMSPSYSKRFALIITVLALLRVALSSIFPLAADEAYHWEWSRHLAFGYYDHPPMTAYVIRIFTTVLGDNEIGVRFGAIVCMTVASIIVFQLGKDISGDDRVSFWSGLLINIIPVLNALFVYMSTDPPSICFWALALWTIYRAVFQERKSYWYLFGLALGGGLLTKFLNVVFIPSVVLFLACSRRYRRLLVTKEPYLAGALALIIISPFIYWNATHDWATFAFNLSKRHTIDVTPLHTVAYVAGQALVVSPMLFAGCMVVSVRSWLRGLAKQENLHLFIGATSSVMFGFFLIVSFLRPVGAHWPAAGYLAACVGLPYYTFVEKEAIMLRHARKAVILAIAMLVMAYGFLFATYNFPKIVVDITSRFVAKSKELYEMHDYRGLAAEVERRARQDDAIIISPSYAVCSRLSFYTPSHLEAHMFGEGSRVYGLNYRFWDGDYAAYIGTNALWVHVDPPNERELQALTRSFEIVEAPEQYHVMLHSERVRTFYFVRCRRLMQYEVGQREQDPAAQVLTAATTMAIMVKHQPAAAISRFRWEIPSCLARGLG